MYSWILKLLYLPDKSVLIVILLLPCSDKHIDARLLKLLEPIEIVKTSKQYNKHQVKLLPRFFRIQLSTFIDSIDILIDNTFLSGYKTT